MKKFLLVVMAVSILLCFAGCNGDTTDNTTTSPVTTTVNAADANRITLAKIGFEEIMNYLNICAAYGVPVEVNDDDTIGDIVSELRSDGSDIPVNNVKESARFFDYAYKNPDYGNGGALYLSKEDADWLAIYAD